MVLDHATHVGSTITVEILAIAIEIIEIACPGQYQRCHRWRVAHVGLDLP